MYQPVMSEENVRRLYFLKLERKKPMTRLLDTILNHYFEQHNTQKHEPKEGGERRCMNAKSADTPSKSNSPKKAQITDTGIVPLAEPYTTS